MKRTNGLLQIAYALRLLWKRILLRDDSGQAEKRVMLLVTEEALAKETIERIAEYPAEGIAVSGLVLTDRDAKGEQIAGVPVVDNLADAAKYICHEYIDEVYVNVAENHDLPADLIEHCAEMGVTVHQQLLLHNANSRQIVEKLVGSTVLTSSMNMATPMQLFLKRTMDIAGGVVGSLIALVLMAVIGPRIKKASPGPILYKQERIGLNGRRFKIYKLRSMYMDADAKKQALMAQNRIEGGMMFKIEFDPRIIGNEVLPDGTQKTGIGEFIRRTSLDEFPQFFNILMGQMSLVGTRPPTVDEWEKYEYHHRARLAAKPGLTGMWQVSGRSKITDFEEVVRLDTQYINEWSMGLDLKILLKTLLVVFKKEGSM